MLGERLVRCLGGGAPPLTPRAWGGEVLGGEIEEVLGGEIGFTFSERPLSASASCVRPSPERGVRGGNPLAANIFPKEPSPIFFNS